MKYSELRDYNRSDLVSKLPLAVPYGIYIEPTNRCNLRCKFCPESFEDYEEQAGKRGDMSWGLYIKILNDLKNFEKLKVIRFHMLGEPLLHPKLPEMIGIAKSLADRIELTTNATALTMAKSKDLIRIGLDYLRVSIYGINETRHKALTQSNIPTWRIFENIVNFKEARSGSGSAKPWLYVKMIDSGDEAENQAFLNKYTPIADECVLEKPMNWNDSHDVLTNVYGENKPKDLFPFKKQVCPFPFYTLVINADGAVTCCCVDWNKKTCAGNVQTQTLSEIWHGQKMRDFRRMHLEGRRHENESCRNCTYLFTAPDNLDGLTQEQNERILA